MQTVEPRIVRLLLVEDNPDDIFLFKAALNRLQGVKFQLVHVERLDEAINVLHKQPIDVAVSDMNLPDSVGPDTLRQLIARAGGVPVIALTGWEDLELGAQLVREGAACYWSKDRLNGPDLAKAIVQVVDQKSAGSSN